MRRNKLGHLEHCDFALTAENDLELIVGQNVALIARILQIVRLDILPELFHDLAAGHRALAGDFLKFGREVHRFEECWICCSNHKWIYVGKC